MRLVMATAGGYGDPFEWPIGKVVEDVRDGCITPQMARDQYGVVVDPDTLQLHELVGKRAGNRAGCSRPCVMTPARVAPAIKAECNFTMCGGSAVLFR